MTPTGNTPTIAVVDELATAFRQLAESAKELAQVLNAGYPPRPEPVMGIDPASGPDRAVVTQSSPAGMRWADVKHSRYWRALWDEQAGYLDKIGTNPKASRRLHLAKLLRYESRALFGRG